MTEQASPSRFTNGRMRLRGEQARILYEILDADIGRSVHLRADAKERDETEVVTAYNQRLAALRAMTEELGRLADEMGWRRETAIDLRIMVGELDVTDYATFIVTEI
jgi:hypothetical protein